MTAREELNELVEYMPEARLREVVAFATFLNWQVERDEWQQFGQAQLARAYGSDEPEYSRADLKSETNS